MGRHWFHLVATCMDSTGNFYRLTQFFFFPLNTRPFPPPLPYSFFPLSFSKLPSILPSTLAPYPAWRSTWPNRPLIVKGTEGLLAVHALVLNFHPSHSSYV